MSNEAPSSATFKRSALRSAVILRLEPNGLTTSTLVYEKANKRRISKRWRGIDKALRRISTAQQTAATEFLERHERSNKKKRNGGVRDLMKNLGKASKKGRKKLKIRIF